MTSSNSRLHTATELAAEFDTTPRALRHYETKGLLEPQRVGTRRVYNYRDRARLQLILRGKRLGFTLAEIREYLELYEVDTGKTEQLKRLHTAVVQRIANLKQQREALESTLEELELVQIKVSDALASRREGTACIDEEALAHSG